MDDAAFLNGMAERGVMVSAAAGCVTRVRARTCFCEMLGRIPPIFRLVTARRVSRSGAPRQDESGLQADCPFCGREQRQDVSRNTARADRISARETERKALIIYIYL